MSDWWPDEVELEQRRQQNETLRFARRVAYIVEHPYDTDGFLAMCDAEEAAKAAAIAEVEAWPAPTVWRIAGRRATSAEDRLLTALAEAGRSR